MKTPRQILDDLFEKIRAQNPSELKTVADEARFLGISMGHLSRIKNQRVSLTDDVIERIVSAFADQLPDEAQRLRLKRELTISRDASTVTSSTAAPRETYVAQGAVKDFFARYAGPETLLCCEYRDRPQINEIRGAFPSIAEDAARAVAAGLAYAFFQPYGKPERIAEAISRCVDTGEDPVGLRYLLDVAIEVRHAYRQVRRRALELNSDIQIALYEADRKKIEISGIQARLFYVNFPGPGTKEREQKIYQWIAGTDNHYFIERDKESIGAGAVAQQFVPVTSYWSKNNRLPATENELNQDECRETVKWSIWKSSAQSAKAK